MLKKFTYLFTVKYLLLLLASLFTLNSCVIDDNKDYGADSGREYAVLDVDMGKSAGAPPTNIYDIISDYDSKITTARLYVFTNDILDTMQVFTYPANTTEYKSTVLVKQAPLKSIYVVVNEPASMKAKFDAIRKVEDLFSLKYDMADIFSKEASSKWDTDWKANPIPMYGKKLNLTNVYNIPNKSTVNVTVPVDRVVACVEVCLACKPELANSVYVDANTNIDIINTATGGSILPQQSVAKLIEKRKISSGPAAQEIVPTVSGPADWSNQKWMFRFYTPERDCSKVEEKLTFWLNGILFNSGDRKNYKVVIGNESGNELKKIERNRIHRIECRVVDELYTDLEVIVSMIEWDVWKSPVFDI